MTTGYSILVTTPRSRVPRHSTRRLACSAAALSLASVLGLAADESASTAAVGAAVVPHASLSVSAMWHDLIPGGQIDLSSPNVATLDSGGPSVVVGSRQNGDVYGVHLSDGSTAAGWPVATGSAVDSTPSVEPAGNGLDNVYVTSGTASGLSGLNVNSGSLDAFGPGGNLQWSDNLTDAFGGGAGARPAIPASPAIGDTGTGAPAIVVGTAGLSAYSINPANGGTNPGWPQRTPDSTFSTAAIANIGGLQEIVAGSDSTAGPGASTDWNGGTVRVVNAYGNTAWYNKSNEVVTSSPAVGTLDGTPTVVFGHGNYWYDRDGASDADALTAVNATNGQTIWTQHLGGFTRGSPALADLLGNGEEDVVQTVWTSLGNPQPNGGGAVDAFGPSGNLLWSTDIPISGDTITGGAVTADFGEGYQDVVVATGIGFDILDGRSGAVVATEGVEMGAADAPGGLSWNGNPANLDMENSPLVVPDPNGGLDIVVAGIYYDGSSNPGFIAAYHVAGSPDTTGSNSWPSFHHDPQLTGSTIPPAPPPGTCPSGNTFCADQGYWLTASDGGIFAYGRTEYDGSAAAEALSRPVVGMAVTPDGHGYWQVASDGGIFTFGDASYFGSTATEKLSKPVVGMAVAPDGGGYWLVASDGGIFTYGDARYDGSAGAAKLNKPIVGMAVTPDGGGYWLVASDGGIFTYGDGTYYGSTGAEKLSKPVVAMAVTPDGHGYWLVAADGGVFAFGDATYFGSTGAEKLSSPIVGMAVTPSGKGYWLVGSDGGVFTFGDAYYQGSTGAEKLNRPVVGVAGVV